MATAYAAEMLREMRTVSGWTASATQPKGRIAVMDQIMAVATEKDNQRQGSVEAQKEALEHFVATSSRVRSAITANAEQSHRQAAGLGAVWARWSRRRSRRLSIAKRRNATAGVGRAAAPFRRRRHARRALDANDSGPALTLSAKSTPLCALRTRHGHLPWPNHDALRNLRPAGRPSCVSGTAGP
jgi:hypothetical protein